jgi:hypothetical protein
MGQDIFPMGPRNGPLPDDFPVDIKFGEIGAAINCSVCKGFSNAGFFVSYRNKARLCCVKCVAGAVSKYQDLHPSEKILEFDVDVDDTGYKTAADVIRAKYPKLSDSEAIDIATLAIRSIG